MHLVAGMSTADLTGITMLRYISKTLLKVRERKTRGEREREREYVCVCVCMLLSAHKTPDACSTHVTVPMTTTNLKPSFS